MTAYKISRDGMVPISDAEYQAARRFKSFTPPPPKKTAPARAAVTSPKPQIASPTPTPTLDGRAISRVSMENELAKQKMQPVQRARQTAYGFPF